MVPAPHHSIVMCAFFKWILWGRLQIAHSFQDPISSILHLLVILSSMPEGRINHINVNVGGVNLVDCRGVLACTQRQKTLQKSPETSRRTDKLLRLFDA
jgi:hypothetical protein